VKITVSRKEKQGSLGENLSNGESSNRDEKTNKNSEIGMISNKKSVGPD
jgi:hypothetical protein